MDKYHFIEIEIYKRLAIYKLQARTFLLAQKNKQTKTNKQTNKQTAAISRYS